MSKNQLFIESYTFKFIKIRPSLPKQFLHYMQRFIEFFQQSQYFTCQLLRLFRDLALRLASLRLFSSNKQTWHAKIVIPQWWLTYPKVTHKKYNPYLFLKNCIDRKIKVTLGNARILFKTKKKVFKPLCICIPLLKWKKLGNVVFLLSLKN